MPVRIFVDGREIVGNRESGDSFRSMLARALSNHSVAALEPGDTIICDGKQVNPTTTMPRELANATVEITTEVGRIAAASAAEQQTQPVVVVARGRVVGG